MKGKKILIGVTGSIAAYKAALLVRLLVKEGAEVIVLMSKTATDFITPLTMGTLAKSTVLIDFFDPENGTWNNHVDLGIWADAFVIAPATANTIAKMASGIADNLLLTTYLSARCPIFVAPAMDLDMYQHPATIHNISILASRKSRIIEAEDGELASGLRGQGRMAEPESIVQKLKEFFSKDLPFKGKKVLITAGPTYERIDPVRYIGNFSTGKMGYALAEKLIEEGAEVTLITGPSSLPIPSMAKVIRIESAHQMYEQCLNVFPTCEIAIMSAAVADFTPKEKAKEKIKSDNPKTCIELNRTKDIAEELGRIKCGNQVLVGFALETDNEIYNAIGKVKKKNLDFIVLNSLKEEGAGFGFDTNKITIISQKGEVLAGELKSKEQVACDIVNYLLQYLSK